MSHTRKNRNRRKRIDKLRKSLKHRPFELFERDGVTYARRSGSAQEATQRYLLPGDE